MVNRTAVCLALLAVTIVACGTSSTPSSDGGNPGDGNPPPGDGATVTRTCSAPAGYRVTSAPGESRRPHLASGGGKMAIVWDDRRAQQTSSSTYFAALDGEGKPAPEVLVGTGISGGIAGPGTEWAVVWAGANKLLVQRLDPNGVALGARIEHPVRSTVTETAIAWTGTEYGVVWASSDPPRDLYFTRLDAQGGLVGSIEHVTTSAYNETWPALAWNGSGYGLTWEDDRDGQKQVYFVELDATGKRRGMDTPISQKGALGTYPAIAWTGSAYGIAWRYSMSVTSAYYIAMVAPDGSVNAGPAKVSPQDGDSHSLEGPGLAWGGDGFGVSFEWYPKAGGAYLHFADLDARLLPRAPMFRATTSAGSGMQARDPALLFVNDAYYAAWAVEPAYDIFTTKIACR